MLFARDSEESLAVFIISYGQSDGHFCFLARGEIFENWDPM